jgi:chaperonin GroEL (HSP60 family)
MERLAHLACKAATIEVGGNTPLEKSMNMDALDDAIKACESAVKHGYYYGNNLAIFNAIHERINDKDACDSTELLALAYLREAFLNVISTIYSNKDDSYDYDKVSEIIDTALNAKKCYDLNTGLFSEKSINSVRTDIEILRGAISIVGTIMSANQYIASEVKAPSNQD